MFDTKTEIELEARLASTAGAAQVINLRWPTDQEWSVRQRARRIVIHHLGRGRREITPPPPSPADLELFRKISLNGTPEATPAEAQKILDILATAEVTAVTVDGTVATVTLNTLAGETTHRLQIPMTDQVLTWRRSASKVMDLPYNQQEVRATPDAGARLYDECGGQSSDYEGPIPAVHKDAVVRNVVEYIDNTLGPKKDDANF